MAQGMSLLDAACAGVFLHGLAADIAAQSLTEYGLAAGDLPGYLPRAFSAILNGDVQASTLQNDQLPIANSQSNPK